MISEEMYAVGAQPSAIRELFAYGQRKAAEVGAENVYDFSIGNPSIPAPSQVNETITRLLREEPSLAVHGYTSAGGSDACREAIAADLNQRFGTSYGKENLFLTCGAAPALTAVLKALVREGEDNQFIAAAPCFPEYGVFVAGAGGRMTLLPAETERFQIDLDALEAAICPATRALLINSPNNPSGVVYTEDTIRAIAALLSRKAAQIGHAIYLISDEPYRELVFHGRTVPFVANFYPDSLICYSYSKSLSLPGERIGYVLVPPVATDSARVYLAVAGAARIMGHVCAPSLMQRTVAQCAHLRPDVALYERNADLLYQTLTGYGYRVAPPDGAFYLFFQAPNGLSGQEFSDFVRDYYNILLVSGASFGCPDWLRLSYCVETQRLEKALPLLERALTESKR